MTTDYPNNRDCEHGSLRGSCVYCDLEEADSDIRRLKKRIRIAQLVGERNTYARISSMQVDAWLKRKCAKEIERVTTLIDEAIR